MLTQAQKVYGGLACGLVALAGCVQGNMRVAAQQGGAVSVLIADAAAGKSLSVTVLKPKIITNLPCDAASYWAERLRNQIENRLKEGARRNGVALTIVAPPENYTMILDEIDRRRTGIVAGAPVVPAGLAAAEVFITGEVKLDVREGTAPRQAWNPRLGGFSVGGAIGGATHRDVVQVPCRDTNIDATLVLVTARGTRPVSFTTDELEPIHREGNAGSLGAQRVDLPPRDQDIREALDNVSQAFAAVFFPSTTERTVRLDAGLHKETQAAVKLLLLARQPDEVHAAQQALEAALQSGGGHQALFALAIAHEMLGEYEAALDTCKRAIDTRGKLYDLSKSDQYAKKRRDEYYLTEARLRRSLACQEAMQELRNHQNARPGDSEHAPQDVTVNLPRSDRH